MATPITSEGPVDQVELLSTTERRVETMPLLEIGAFGKKVQAVVSANSVAEFLPEETGILTALRSIFDRTAGVLAHGVSWQTIEASLAVDREAIAILGDLFERGGEPTVTAEENGEIRWNEVVRNVPLKDFRSIPMSGLAYDEVGESKKPKGSDCRGNAVASGKRIHPRVELTTKEESEKLAQAGLITDGQSYPWLHTPDSERGDQKDQYGGCAWYGVSGEVHSFDACDSHKYYGARFALRIKKVEIMP